MSSRYSRRPFLKSSAAIAAATTLPAWFLEQSTPAAAQTLAANDKPGIALIGCGGRGRGIGRDAAQHGNLVAYCDLDDSRLAQAKQMWPAATAFKDFRQLVAQKDIDVVVNGTPDHWHTLVNMAALKAGKDVYSEKPLTLTIDEGRRLVAAVKSSQRILQTGSQQRQKLSPRLRARPKRPSRQAAANQRLAPQRASGRAV